MPLVLQHSSRSQHSQKPTRACWPKLQSRAVLTAWSPRRGRQGVWRQDWGLQTGAVKLKPTQYLELVTSAPFISVTEYLRYGMKEAQLSGKTVQRTRSPAFIWSTMCWTHSALTCVYTMAENRTWSHNIMVKCSLNCHEKLRVISSLSLWDDEFFIVQEQCNSQHEMKLWVSVTYQHR